MLKRLVLNLISFVLLLNSVSSYVAVSPTWLTSPYFRASNQKVINSNTNSASTPTYAFTFSSAMTGIPNLAYGIKSYRGTDRLKSTNFEIKRVSLSATTFTVSIQLFGSGKLFLLAVPYIAIDPTFPHHLNSFDNVALEYSSTLTNITVSSASLTSFSQTINYTSQSAANTYKTFTTPLTSNKIVLFITSLCVVANSTAAFNLDISYSILSSSQYSWTATVYQYATVSKLHFSLIIYNQDDVTASKLYQIVNEYWISDGSANYQAFPLQLVDNMILGLTDFHADNGNCGLDYNWNFQTNITGISYAIYFSISNPAPNSTASGGQNYVRSTLFYIKTWSCSSLYPYYNLTSANCQDACASYYYFNATALTCTTCYYTCYNCSLASSATSCTSCETGLQRELVSNACVCKDGYFQDGFAPACKACSDVDPNSLTCSYTIDSTLATTIYESIFNQTTWATDILVNFTSLTCAATYFVNGSRLCQSCPSYCLTCTDAVTCTSCDSSSPATLYTDNLCYLCSVTNCTSCYPANVCISCSTGFVVDTGACITCEAACTCNGWVLPKVSGTCSTLCGDGYMLGVEECDDGNTDDHDGCSSTCTVQTCALNCSCDGWTAPWVTANSSCTSVCGDGFLRGIEQCDDGNLIDGDGCSSTCLTEGCSVSCLCDGWTSPVVSGVCSTLCGDGFLRGTEQCDDGNIIDHDGCSSTCTTQTCDLNCSCDGWTAPWVTANSSCTSVCGDGYLRGVEQCDDGNTDDHDGCSSSCLSQSCAVGCTCDGWTTPWVTANTSCTSVCGDSLLRGTEQCDDGNTDDHDGCSSTCTTQACAASCLCGGWTLPWISADNTCTPICGDGLVLGSEQCDDGNVLNGDGCDSVCKIQIAQSTVLLSQEMSQYPALIIFLLGFRIVGLQMLNVFQSFQLILTSLQLTSFQLSYNIHGYTDNQYFPLPIPVDNHIFTNFNFMYLGVIGLFVVAVMFELYYAICHKSNKILDANKFNDEQTQKSDELKSNSEEDHSEEISDFTVHYKSERKPNTDLNNTAKLEQSQVMKPLEEQTFWGCVIFRQLFYNLLVNVLCVFVYSFVEQIRIVSIGSFINFETMAVVVSMIFLLAVILTVCAVENHSFGENHMKFHKNQAIEYWVLMIGEKVIFAAILASKQSWSLEALLAVKFVLLAYYCYTSLYFETIQKVRSVVTHFLHFLLILAVTLNEQLFKPNDILSIFPTFFMEYVYAGLLSLVLLICFAFYIREIMYLCQADFRHDDKGQVFAIVNGAISAVFDVKNSDVMEDSAHPFNITTMKGSNIFDDLKNKKIQKSTANIESPQGPSHSGGAMAKKVVSINSFNHMISPPASAHSNVQFASISKKHFQTHRRNPVDVMKMNPISQQNDVQIDEVNIPDENQDSPKPNQSNLKKTLYKPQQIKLNFEQEKNPNNSLEIQNPYRTETKSFRKPARRVAMKNRRKQVEGEKNFKTDEDLDIDQTDVQINQKVQPIFRRQNPLRETKKQSRPLTFYSKKNKQNMEQQPHSLGERGPKHSFESQNKTYNYLNKIESQDAFSITFQ